MIFFHQCKKHPMRGGAALIAGAVAGFSTFTFAPPATFANGKQSPQAMKEFPASDATPVPFTTVLPFQVSVPPTRVFQDALGNSDSTRAVNLITSVSPLPSGSTSTSNSGGDTWLGTQYGVKRLRARTKTVHYYTQADGLPGDYVESVQADPITGGAWCLVRVTITHPASEYYNPPSAGLAFCAWNKQTDTWRVVHTIASPPNGQNNGYSGGSYNEMERTRREFAAGQGKSLMANSPGFVVFAPRIVSRQADAVAYLWDKKQNKVRPIPWEAGEQSTRPLYVGVNFLWMDELRQTLWLGTSRGLQSYRLSDGKWRTFLPDRWVSAATLTPGKNAFYLSCRPKSTQTPGAAKSAKGDAIFFDDAIAAPNQVPAPKEQAPLWGLVRFDLASGAAEEMPPAPMATQPAPAYGYNPSRNYNEPVGLFADGHNIVWATQAASPPVSYNFDNGDNGTGGIDRFDLAARTWRHIRFAVPPNPADKRPRPFVPPDGWGLPPTPPPYSPDADLALMETVPHAALVPLALTNPTIGGLGYGGGGSSEDLYGYVGGSWRVIPPSSPIFWISHRFPQWFGPIDAAATGAFVSPRSPRSATSEINADGSKNNEQVWLIDDSRCLTTMPRADLGPSEGVKQIAPYESAVSPLSLAHAEAFPLEAVFSDHCTPVSQMVPVGENPSRLLIQNERALFLVDTSKNDWAEIVPPGGGNGSMYSSGTAFVPSTTAGSGSVPLFMSNLNNGGFVQRWNPAARVFETAADFPVPPNARLLGPGENGAVWFAGQNNTTTAWYQAPTPPDSFKPFAPVVVSPTVPAAWNNLQGGQPSLPRPVDAWGSRIWYAVSVRRDFFESTEETNDRRGGNNSPRTCLAGFDITTKKWTPPLPLPVNSGEPSLLHVQNRTYAATTAGNPNGCVWEWKEAAQAWQVVAPSLPLEPGLYDNQDTALRRPVVPAFVDENYVWVLVVGRMMARFDRAVQKWETVALPPELRDKPDNSYNSDRQTKVLQTGPNTFCVSGEKSGLWRLHGSPSDSPRTLPHVWEPVGRQVVIRSDTKPNTAESFNLHTITVTPHTVWVTGSQQTEPFTFAARLDKTTKTWTVWDDKSGFPIHDYIGSVIADGDTVWITHQSGTYRYDLAANRWTLILRNTDNYVRVPEQAAVYADGSGKRFVGSVSRITVDENYIYLLLNYPAPNVPDTLLYRWDKATRTLEPLPFPLPKQGLSNRGRSGTALLDEPSVLWVGTSEGIFAWDKKAQKWSDVLPLPAGIAPIQPYTITRTSSDNALMLTGGTSSPANGTGMFHTVRLVSPPFLKRP